MSNSALCHFRFFPCFLQGLFPLGSRGRGWAFAAAQGTVPGLSDPEVGGNPSRNPSRRGWLEKGWGQGL